MFRTRWKKLFDRSRKIPATRRRTIRPTFEALEERTLLTAGALDPTFGPNGLVATDFHAAGRAVAVEPNSQIIVAGSATDPQTGFSDFALARNNANGQLDTSFGNGGEVLTDFSTLLGGSASATSIAVQGDGKIVVGGYAFDNSGDANKGHFDFALARYNVNGTLDNSFGSNGRVVTDLTSVLGQGDDRINGLALQGDGEIVAAGFATGPSGVQDFAVARFNPDGNPDTTFGPNSTGLVVTNVSGAAGFAPGNSAASAVVILGDGKIVAAGYGVDPNKRFNDFALARYTPSGRLDGTFNTNGVVLTDFGNGNPEGNDAASSVALSGNQIIAAGYATPDSSTGDSRFAVARYTTFGQLDTTFAGTGKVSTQISDADWVNGVAVQGDGKIVAAGVTLTRTPTAVYGVTWQFAVARYDTDGSLDGSFNPTGTLPGVVTTSFFQNRTHVLSNDQAYAMALQPDGKIVAAGTTTEPNGDSAFAVARYLATTGTVQISPPAPVTEGQPATITITRSDTSGPASVQISTSDGTATAGVDYVRLINQTVQFLDGQSTATVQVSTIDHGTVGDGSKTLTLTLSNPQGVALGSHTTAVLTINEHAPPGEKVQLDKSSYSVSAGASPTQLQVVVDRDSPAGTVDVPFTLSSGADYTVATPSPLVFQPGQTQASITLNILPIGAATSNESVTLTLGTPTSPDDSANVSLGSTTSATVTILEPETVQFEQSSYSVPAGASPTLLQIPVVRSAAAGTVQVSYTVSSGFGFPVATAGPLVFQPGQTQGFIPIPIPAALPGAGDQSFTVTLGAPTSPDGSATVTPGPTTQATVNVLAPESFTVSGPDSVGHNSSTATYTVTRLGPTDGTATLQYSLSGSAISAGEYQGPTFGTLIIGPGASQGTIGIPISNNGQYVGDQSLTLTLTNVTLSVSNQSALGAPSQKTTTIRETNPPPHRAIVAQLVPVRMGRRTMWMIEVFYADDGTPKAKFVSPFQQPAYHGIQVSAVQGNNTGLPDQVVLTGRKGHRTVSIEIPV